MPNTAEGTKIIPAVFKQQPANQRVGNSRPTRLLCSRNLAQFGLVSGHCGGSPLIAEPIPVVGLDANLFGRKNGCDWWAGVVLSGDADWLVLPRITVLYGFLCCVLYKVLHSSKYIILPSPCYSVYIFVLLVFYQKDSHAITTRYENYRKPTCPTPIQYVMEPPPAARPNQKPRTYLRARENVTFGIWRDPEAF